MQLLGPSLISQAPFCKSLLTASTLLFVLNNGNIFIAFNVFMSHSNDKLPV